MNLRPRVGPEGLAVDDYLVFVLGIATLLRLLMRGAEVLYYTQLVSLQLPNIAIYNKRSTGEKLLINPNKG